jgi:hypothetical protein
MDLSAHGLLPALCHSYTPPAHTITCNQRGPVVPLKAVQEGAGLLGVLRLDPPTSSLSQVAVSSLFPTVRSPSLAGPSSLSGHVWVVGWLWWREIPDSFQQWGREACHTESQHGLRKSRPGFPGEKPE